MTKVLSVSTAQLQATAGANLKLESNEVLLATDLVCEGPIEGLVDKEGSVLKYIASEQESATDNLSLGKGVYYNEVPILDSRLNKLNFVTAGFNISNGEEMPNRKFDYPSTVFRYGQKMYLNEKRYNFGDGDASLKTNSLVFIKKEGSSLSAQAVANNSLDYQNYLVGKEGKFDKIKDLISELDAAKLNCQEFSHKIKNKYADEIAVQIKIDQLYDTNKGNTVDTALVFAIEVNQDASDSRYIVLVSVYGTSKSGYVKEITLKVDQGLDFSNNSYVKVYSLNKKIGASEPSKFKEFSVSAIVERIKSRGSFTYPFSAIVRSAVSSRHFNQEPQRSFDLKLLKIKIPSNYDPEAKEYNGNWDGTFSKFLQWTDNPAWIYYDITTNSRYGVGNGSISEKDLNKWELYKIAKHCDELVKNKEPIKYLPDNFEYSTTLKNTILVTKNFRTLEQFRTQYPPAVGTTSAASQNGGSHNSLIFLSDITNDGEIVNKIYKKIIWDIEEFDSYFAIRLINDFGPRFLFERETSGDLFTKFAEENVLNDTSRDITNQIKNSQKNSEASAKSFCLTWLKENETGAESAGTFAREIINAPIFDETVVAKGSIGQCAPRTLNYRDPVENRFSANVYIDNETECLKLLNDFSSIFRGLTYYKNNLITATIDVNKPISYLFNNTNVKNGLFTYSNGSLDGNYTVAKVIYRDKFQNYKDEVEVVEDSALIKDYGIISKEILGFGITSRGQARRIGEWLLATNRFENQTVSFATDLQGIALKPSDIIQIEDQGKNDSTLQGRVTSVDYTNSYITVDRKLNLNLDGSIIKFIFNGTTLSSQDLDNLSSVSDADLDNSIKSDVVELRISRIENNTNRVYFDTTYNFGYFTRIVSSTPFLIENALDNTEQKLFKIISIAEVDNNEYSLFCIKHNPKKYDLLDRGSFNDPISTSNNLIAFNSAETLKEIDLQNYTGDSWYSIEYYSLNELNNLSIDYAFSENKSSLSYSVNKDYSVLTVKFSLIFAYVAARAVANVAYFKEVQNVFNTGGGLLCKLTLKNQSIKFALEASSFEDKTVFLGRLSDVNNIGFASIRSTSGIRLYVYNKDNQIIEI